MACAAELVAERLVEELKAEGIAATWEAERDFDPARGVPLDAFVQQRVWTRTLNRYRREWAYVVATAEAGWKAAMTAMSRLTKAFLPSRTLSHCKPVCAGCPTRNVASLKESSGKRRLRSKSPGFSCLTQSGISRRKQRILEQLRRWLGRTDKEKN